MERNNPRPQKPEEALKCYKQALKLNPQNKTLWYMQGKTLQKLGKHQKAKKYYKKALKELQNP